MTIADDNKLCNPCRLRGLKRKAHRIVIVGKTKVLMCDEDFRIKMGWPQLTRETQSLVDSWGAPVLKSK